MLFEKVPGVRTADGQILYEVITSLSGRQEFNTKMNISHKRKKTTPLKGEDQCKLPVRQRYYLTHLQVRVLIVVGREHCTDSGGNKSSSILFFWTVFRAPSWKSQDLSPKHLVLFIQDFYSATSKLVLRRGQPEQGPMLWVYRRHVATGRV